MEIYCNLCLKNIQIRFVCSLTQYCFPITVINIMNEGHGKLCAIFYLAVSRSLSRVSDVSLKIEILFYVPRIKSIHILFTRFFNISLQVCPNLFEQRRTYTLTYR